MYGLKTSGLFFAFFTAIMLSACGMQPPTDSFPLCTTSDPFVDVLSQEAAQRESSSQEVVEEPRYTPPKEEDLSGVTTPWDTTYVNEELGMTVAFPPKWQGSYIPVVSSFVEDGKATPRIEFYFKDDMGASLAVIMALSHKDWEWYNSEDGSPLLSNYLGENSKYVFVGSGSHGNPYAAGNPNAAQYDKQHVGDLASITKTMEPKP